MPSKARDSLGGVLRIKSWLPEIGYAVAFGLITLAVATGFTHGVDLAVRDVAKDLQNEAVWWIARVLNLLGQGAVVAWALAGGLTLWTYWRTRNWKVLLPWLAAFALTYLTIGPVKIWSMRTSPNSEGPDAVEFFNKFDTYTMGYPSGHVVNAIVWWAVIAILWRHIPFMRIAPPIIVFVTTIYLGHHWLTDNLAAVALGLLIDRLVRRVDRWRR